MIYIATKGRFIKKDISITITESKSGWTANIDQFSINSNLISFSMPSFPYPQMTRAQATVNISCKQDQIYEATYLYTSCLDGTYIIDLSLP